MCIKAQTPKLNRKDENVRMIWCFNHNSHFRGSEFLLPCTLETPKIQPFETEENTKRVTKLTSLFQSGRGFWRSFIWINGHTWPSIPPTIGSSPIPGNNPILHGSFTCEAVVDPGWLDADLPGVFRKRGWVPDVFRAQTWKKSTVKVGGQLWISHYSIQIGLGCGFLHWYPEFSSPSIVAMALPWRFPHQP